MNEYEWKEATYGTWMIKIKGNIIYWNKYDNYFQINNEIKKYGQNEIKSEIDGM